MTKKKKKYALLKDINKLKSIKPGYSALPFVLLFLQIF